MMFWVDLSTAKLIDGNFSTATPAGTAAQHSSISQSQMSLYLPTAKIGGGNYLYVFSLYLGNYKGSTNYYGLSAAPSLAANTGGCGSCLDTSPGLTVIQAANIDQKMDDGLPQSGKLLARYLNPTLTGPSGGGAWAAGGGNLGAYTGNSFPTTAATVGSSTTCYDNSTSRDGQTAANGNPQHYSTEMSGGTGINCALSFEFQQ